MSNLVNITCSETETCVAESVNSDIGHCDCRNQHERVNDTYCRPIINGSSLSSTSDLTEHSRHGGNLAVAITLTLCLVMLIVGGIYLAYRYRLMTWIRKKMSRQNNGNYDEVMIGEDDDDPPLR